MQKNLNIISPSNSLGMYKGHYELKNAFENMEQEVDYLDINRIYPNGNKLINNFFCSKSIQERILDFLKEKSNTYDIIDANQRCILYSKESFGFTGKLIYRSHGLPPIYRIAEQHPLYKKMENKKHTNRRNSLRSHLGNLKRYLLKEEEDWALLDSIKYAYIVNVLNKAEYDYLKEYGIPTSKLRLVSVGLDDEYIEKGKEYIGAICDRAKVTFIGSWITRKGVDLIPAIVEKLPDSVKGVNLLGTGGTNEFVHSFLRKSAIRINVYSH